MRLLFTTSATGGPRGGSEHLWRQAAERLAGQGHDVTAVVRWDDTSSLDTLRRAGGTVIEIPPPTLGTPFLTRVARKLHVASPPAVVFDSLPKPDLVISSLCFHLDAPAMAEECQRRGWRYAQIVQAVGELAWPDDAGTTVLSHAFQSAAMNWFVAHANQRLVETQIAQALFQADIVFNPFLVPATDPPPWPNPQQWKLATVARYELAAKAHDVVFAVLATSKWRDRPVTLTLFGRGGNEQTLRALIRRYDLNERVTLAGFTTDVRDIWVNHHALLLASRSEGLPLAVVEAMLCGRVCVVTDTGGSAELLKEGRTGFIASAPTIELVDAALERAWAVREQWQTIGHAAMLEARSRVSNDPVAHFCERVLAIAGQP